MIKQWLTKNMGTKWSGRGELWLDPEGNYAENYDCALSIDSDGMHYSWSYADQRNKGKFTFNESGAVWVDSWHQPKPVECFNVPEAWGLFSVRYSYEVPDSSNWGWRSMLSERPDGSLVLQMTNITPWGEEGRAVKMVFTRKKA